MIHMTQFFVFISNCDQKYIFGKILPQTKFYNWGPCEKCVPWILSLYDFYLHCNGQILNYNFLNFFLIKLFFCFFFKENTD